MDESFIKDESDFEVDEKNVLNSQGFGFYDTYGLLKDYILSSSLKENFDAGNYEEMIYIIRNGGIDDDNNINNNNKNNNQKDRNDIINVFINAQHDHECYLKVKLPIMIENKPKYIKLFYGINKKGSLINALRSMALYSRENLWNDMQARRSMIVGFKDGQGAHYIWSHYLTLKRKESANLFDLIPSVTLYGLDQLHSYENAISNEFHLKLDEIHLPFKYDFGDLYVNREDMDLTSQSTLGQANFFLSSEFYDPNVSDPFIFILKHILEYIKHDDDILNSFINILTIMSLNQMIWTRKMGDDTNFLNWYYYLEIERQIKKITKKSTNFFLKIYYGSFLGSEYEDPPYISFLPSLYKEIIYLNLDRKLGYIFKKFYDEKITKINNYHILYGKNNIDKTDYVKLIKFFKNEKQPLKQEFYTDLEVQKNTWKLIRRFETFMLDELNLEKQIHFYIVDGDKF